MDPEEASPNTRDTGNQARSLSPPPAAPRPAPVAEYRVYYELDVADCEPELVATVATLTAAWAVVQEQALNAWKAVPEACPHPDAYARVATRADMKGHEHAFFDIPAALDRERPTWIAVSDRDTFFVFPGDWEAHCEERNAEIIAEINAETGGHVTYIGGV